MKTIRIRDMKMTKRDIEELEHFQGNLKDLPKENFEKLKRVIEKNGFSAPIFVWSDGTTNHILDGHQRLRTLKTMRTTGYEIPPVPVVEIEAKDIQEARRLVPQYATVFGITNEDGLLEFLNLAEIPLDEALNDFRLPDMEWVDFFESNAPGEPEAEIEGDEEFSRELDEKNNYLVFIFDNKDEFRRACEKYGVQTVRFNPSATLNEGFEGRGLGRILDGTKIL